MRKTLASAGLLGGLLLAAGCQTFDLGGGSRIVEITSQPTGATVTVEGFGECETPCRVEVDAPRMVSIARIGYLPQRFQITPKSRRVDVVLEHAAPTGDVEAETLPEL